MGGAELYYRAVGEGPPLLVLHGGPEFDHTYLLPEIDLLAHRLRVLCYDQRGRGRSAHDVEPESVTIESEIEDIELLRGHLGLEHIAVLGHSWGGLLAAEYAVRHPERVSRLILMNTAPLTHQAFHFFRTALRESRLPEDLEIMQRLAATPEYQAGDVEMDNLYCSLHFKPTIADPKLLNELVGRLWVNFTPATILLARTIAGRLAEQTWMLPGYDVLGRLSDVAPPTLVLHGESDFIPLTIAQAIAMRLDQSRLEVIEGCGHFAYAEQPELLAGIIADFVLGVR